MGLSVTAYGMLFHLADNEKTAILKSSSIAEIMEDPELGQMSPGTIYRTIDILLGQGYIEQGVRVGTANTYFITKKGLEHLEQASGEKIGG